MTSPLVSGVTVRPGVRMPYWRTAGDHDRWVLFLHGACADHRTFDEQIGALDESTGVLLPDLRGQGESRLDPGVTADFSGVVEDLVAMIEQLGIERVSLVGHSFGSHVAQELAWRHPGRVERLVLIGCYDQHRERDQAEASRVAITSAIVGALPWRVFAKFSVKVGTRDAALRTYLFETHLAAGKSTFLELGRSGSFAKHPVDRYQMPVLLIRGAHEYSATLEGIYRDIAARSDDSRIVVISDAGHICHQEQPAQVNAALVQFLY